MSIDIALCMLWRDENAWTNLQINGLAHVNINEHKFYVVSLNL